MKRTLLLISVAFAAVFTSCSSDTFPTGSSYPSSPYPTYPSTGGGRNGRVVVTRDGRVVDQYGRVVGNVNNMPPGQAKKIYGSQSARAYAPGQRKKAYREYYDNDRNDNGRGRGKHGRRH